MDTRRDGSLPAFPARIRINGLFGRLTHIAIFEHFLL